MDEFKLKNDIHEIRSYIASEWPGIEERKHLYMRLTRLEKMLKEANKTMDLNKIFELYPGKTELFYKWSIKQEDAQVLFDVTKELNPKKIAVIGVFKGVSSHVIIQALDSFDTMYNIDPFFDGYIAGDNYELCYRDSIKDVAKGKIVTLKGYASTKGPETITFANEVKDVPEHMISNISCDLDLCFIDGDHNYPVCLHDFQEVWPKMRKGGKVVLHDTISWKHTIDKLLDYIRNLPDASLELHPGIDGVGVVTKK